MHTNLFEWWYFGKAWNEKGREYTKPILENAQSRMTMVSTRSQQDSSRGKEKETSAQTNPHPNPNPESGRKPTLSHHRDNAPTAPQPSGRPMASTLSLPDNTTPTITSTKDTSSTANGIQALAKREKKESQEPTVKEVVLGNLWVKPWYKSSYAEEITGRPGAKGWVNGLLERLYVCQWCFKYTVDLTSYLGHTVCPSISKDYGPMAVKRRRVKSQEENNADDSYRRYVPIKISTTP